MFAPVDSVLSAGKRTSLNTTTGKHEERHAVSGRHLEDLRFSRFELIHYFLIRRVKQHAGHSVESQSSTEGMKGN